MAKDAKISVFKEGLQYRVQSRIFITKWLSMVVGQEGKVCGALSFILCSDDHLLALNRKYLKTSTLTDVIAFDYGAGKIVSGDVFISLDRVRENAAEFNVSVTNELRRVMVHGTLHLLGFSDKTKAGKAEMTRKEDLYLSLFPLK